MKIIRKLIIVSFMILVSISTFATNENIAPQVEITSPKDGFVTNAFIIQFTVSFSAYKPGPGKGAQGNVSLIILKMNDKEIGRFDNPPQRKDGIYTFQIDLSNLPNQILTFSAIAYQGNPKAGIFRISSLVKVILDRTPPVVSATILPLPNQKAWNNTDVTVTFSATDNLSGVAKVDPPVTVTSEGANQVITGRAWDKVGNEGSVSVMINIDKTQPQIANLSPANGEIVKISTPTISASFSDNLSGIDNGLVRIILDGNDVTSNATITSTSVTYIPITALADGNHTITINISDNASNTATTSNTFQIVTVPPIPEGAGFVDGIVYSSRTNQTLEGAKISATGISGIITSGPDGRFTFIVPNFSESNILDVTLAIEKQGYTTVYRSVSALSRHHVSVDDIYLVLIDTKVTKITPAGGIATNSSEAVTLIFPQGAAKTDIDVVITQFENPKELPQPLPNSSIFTYAVNLKPDYETFDKPVQMKIVNSLGFAPGTPIPIGYYNYSENRWIGVGMANVSTDGKYVECEITKFSNYDLNFAIIRPSFPRSPGDRNNEDPGKDNKDHRDPEEKACSSQTASKVYSHEGSLIEDHRLPSINLLGKPFNLTFHYDSFLANPNVLITNEILQEVVPSSFTWNLKIEGINKEVKFQGAGGRILSQFIWDGVNISGEKLPTGAYPYTLELSNDYRDFRFATTDRFGGPPISSTNITVPFPVPLTKSLKGKAIINNQIKSPFGSGWTLEGLDRIHKMSDGSVLLTKGNGGSLVFNYDFGATFELISDSDYLGRSIAFDYLGNLYIVKGIGSGGIVKITPTGEKIYMDLISPVPGSHWIFYPINMTVDKQNNVYICFSNTDGYKPPTGVIVKITPEGAQSVVTSDLNPLAAIAVDSKGNIIVAESTLFTFYGIKKITPSGEITQFFNIGQNPIFDMVIDSKDNLYFSASVPGGLVDIIKVIPTGEMSTFVSGLRAFYRGHTMCIDIDTDDNIYTLVASRGWDQVIIKIFPDGSITRIGGEVRMELDTVGPSIVVSSNSLVLSGGPLQIPVSTLEFNQPLVKSVGAIKSKKGFISPDGDFSTLVKNDDGTFTRRLKDGTRYNFDENGLLISVVDRNRNSHTTLYQYIDANNDGKAEEISKIILPNQQEYNFIYDINGKLQSVTDPASKVTSFNIDANGNLIQITNPDNSTRKFVYDDRHLITSKFNERNMKTEYTYNNYGRLTKVLLPDSVAFQFNPAEIQGLINDIPVSSGTEINPAPAIGPVSTTVIDARGFTTTLKTDKFGGVTENINALGKVWMIERDFNGLPLLITTPSPPTTTYGNEYDRKGNLLLTGDASGGPTTRYFYESTFNLITNIIDGKRNVTRFEYDTKGNLIITRDPLGRVTTLNYDSAGNVISSVDPLGRITQFNYDIVNRLTRVIDADNRITNYEYDAIGNLTAITDVKGNRTSFEYDSKDRLITTTNQFGQRKTFSYDSNGNLNKTIDAKNQTITFEYDAINQLTRKVRIDDIFTYGYDNLGNLTLVNNNASSLTMNYDGLSRLTKVTTVGQTQAVTTINYTYDVLGNRLSMKDPVGGITSYTYCGSCAATLISIVNPKGQEVAFEYDRLTRRTNTLFPNMMKGSYSYDFASQLTNITHSRSSLIYQTNTYTYDNAGNRTSMIDNDGTHNYGYDVLNRLTSATHPQVFNPSESFSYDAVGNRTSSHLSTFYSYDSVNRLLEDEKYTYSYDANGNMIQRQNKSTLEIERFDYDSENQLTHYTASDGTFVEYKYDGLGRRITKLFNGLKTDSRSRVYTYDNEDILEERSGDGATILARYTHGPGIDEPLIMERSGQSYFYHSDGLGSVTNITDTTGNIVKSYVYDSFGQIKDETGAVENFYTYTSREKDSESGLY